MLDNRQIMQQTTILSLKDITLKRGENSILHDASLDISHGELVYLIGKVGSGKSTLLKSIYADVPITSGSAEFGAFDLRKIKRSRIPYLRRQLGIIFQDFQLMIDRTVEKNLEFVLRATGWTDRRDIKQRIEEVLTQVGLESKGYKLPHELSGGEQQRVVISRALLNKPKLILADEPTGNLDPETGEQIVNLLHTIKADGTSVLMSTHNYAMVKKYPSRIVKIQDGHLIEMQIREEIMDDSESESEVGVNEREG